MVAKPVVDTATELLVEPVVKPESAGPVKLVKPAKPAAMQHVKPLLENVILKILREVI